MVLENAHSNTQIQFCVSEISKFASDFVGSENGSKTFELVTFHKQFLMLCNVMFTKISYLVANVDSCHFLMHVAQIWELQLLFSLLHI